MRLRWADFGCSLRGGVVIAERSGQFGEVWNNLSELAEVSGFGVKLDNNPKKSSLAY